MPNLLKLFHWQSFVAGVIAAIAILLPVLLMITIVTLLLTTTGLWPKNYVLEQVLIQVLTAGPYLTLLYFRYVKVVLQPAHNYWSYFAGTLFSNLLSVFLLYFDWPILVSDNSQETRNLDILWGYIDVVAMVVLAWMVYKLHLKNTHQTTQSM